MSESETAHTPETGETTSKLKALLDRVRGLLKM